MPYLRMRNAEVVDMVCQKNKRLTKPPGCPEAVYHIMYSCWKQVSASVRESVLVTGVVNLKVFVSIRVASLLNLWIIIFVSKLIWPNCNSAKYVGFLKLPGVIFANISNFCIIGLIVGLKVH